MRESKGPILALDIGDVRVGVAISDRNQVSCRALTTLRKPSGEAEREILKLIEKYRPVCIVVGLPLNEHGQPTSQSEKVLSFCRRLGRRTELPIVEIDEYLSTEEAKQRLITEGKSPVKLRKTGVIDSNAASIILERYLQSIRS